jgi:serine/threonine-protein kinase RsbW
LKEDDYDMKPSHTANIAQTPEAKCAGTSVSPFSITIEAGMRSEINAISPLVEQLMQLLERSRCIVGHEWAVEVALQEALSNAVVHGNGMEPHKFVEVRCRCERGKGVWLAVRDQGQGFDPNAVPDPLAPDRLEAVHGRGIFLIRSAMDEVSFEAGGYGSQDAEARGRPRIDHGM